MPGGRPPKPVERKRATGRSPGRDSGGRAIPAPVVTLATSAHLPPTPEGLNSAGREAWTRLWTAGQAWLSPTTDLDLLTRLAEAHDEREAMRDAIANSGYLVPGSTGQPVLNPLVPALRALEAQITKYESLCGFTPTDRARLGYAEVKRVSKLDELLAKRRKDQASG
ncbi:phage terminase small subunit P27 family [Pseudonocardiaceae bacterium YIM PH 21723]|nr:phage terminase small subunit P27 family [Pseudonocardiaceae bacterium YIM PH 21723]